MHQSALFHRRVVALIRHQILQQTKVVVYKAFLLSRKIAKSLLSLGWVALLYKPFVTYP